MVLEAGLEQHKQAELPELLQVVSKRLAESALLVVVQLVGGKSLEHHRTLNLQFGP